MDKREMQTFEIKVEFSVEWWKRTILIQSKIQMEWWMFDPVRSILHMTTDRPKLDGRLLDIPYKGCELSERLLRLATATQVIKIQRCRTSIYGASIYHGRWIYLWGDWSTYGAIHLSMGRLIYLWDDRSIYGAINLSMGRRSIYGAIEQIKLCSKGLGSGFIVELYHWIVNIPDGEL